MPAELVPAFTRLMINTVSCTSTFSQYGAVEALTGPQDATLAMVREFAARRSLIVEGLDALPGVTSRMPHGAFYAFPEVSGTGMDGPRFAERMLHEAGVSVLSGTAFGRVGAGHVRVSYANSQDNLRLALERMGALLRGEPVPGAGLADLVLVHRHSAGGVPAASRWLNGRQADPLTALLATEVPRLAPAAAGTPARRHRRGQAAGLHCTGDRGTPVRPAAQRR